MGNSTRKVISALCFLLLLLEVGSAKNIWKRALHTRLAEKSHGIHIAVEEAENKREIKVEHILDWLVQPKPRWLGGNGWLLDGPEEVLQAEACSTTEDGAEPLLCPSGYECHILSPGDMAEGIPNRGQCVKQRRQADGRLLRHTFYKEYPEGDSKNVAEHGKGQQRHFQ
ncbi:WAP four-disulfide core domain protein 1 [Pteropus alecto]|uniref:WAP four-disulfide core domain protein 1 n=1 Tax=Pteropus alecto TaxID=9402 RepID=UPI0007688543|nr:WAP four-disulfide core domain protein 1 [Pteropus alecto]